MSHSNQDHSKTGPEIRSSLQSVWSIFRFIFEGIGFIVSAGAILLGYAIYVRIQNVMAAYLKEVCEKEKWGLNCLA